METQTLIMTMEDNPKTLYEIIQEWNDDDEQPTCEELVNRIKKWLPDEIEDKLAISEYAWGWNECLKEICNNLKMTELETSKVGDVLEDGSIVLKKENGIALLVAPASTQVECAWSPEFPEVFQKLKEQGFNPSQWFVPTKEQLLLAYKTIPEHFISTLYWSNEESKHSTKMSWGMSYYSGNILDFGKECVCGARAFRCVTY